MSDSVWQLWSHLTNHQHADEGRCNRTSRAHRFRLELLSDHRVPVFLRLFAGGALEASIHASFCTTFQLYHPATLVVTVVKPVLITKKTLPTKVMMMKTSRRGKRGIRLSRWRATWEPMGSFSGPTIPRFHPWSTYVNMRGRGGRVCICEGEYADRTSRLSCIAAQIRLLSGRRALKAASPATPVHAAVHKPCM